MGKEQPGQAFKQIKNLLMVLVLGIASAGTFAAILLYLYGPTGAYTLGNLIVAPTEIEGQGVNKNTPEPSTRFIFDKIEFSYWSPQTRQWTTRPISLEDYGRFYDSYASDKSERATTEPTIAEFNQAPPLKLTLTGRFLTAGSGLPSKIFQEIQFASEGDFYRVELNEQKAGTQWAYFYHPRTYLEIMSLFAKEGDLHGR